MLTEVVSANLHCWPEAEAEVVGGRWFVINKGRPAVAPVLRGLIHQLDSVARSEPEWEAHLRLVSEETLHEAFEALGEAATYDTPSAAVRLADWCKTHPVPDLCRHGLPLWHANTDQFQRSVCKFRMVKSHRALSVDQVQTMLVGLDGVRALTGHLARQRRPATRRMVENALAWPLLEDPTKSRHLPAAVFRDELERTGKLSVEHSRQLVTTTLEVGFRSATIVPRFHWAPQHRPQYVLEVHTGIGVYLVDFARHVIDASTGADIDRSISCQVCGQPYTPRTRPRNGSAYCRRPECQRERQRRNQASSRARRLERTQR